MALQHQTFMVRVFVPGPWSPDEKQKLSEALGRGTGNGHVVAEGVVVRIEINGVDAAQSIKATGWVLAAVQEVKPELTPDDLKLLEVDDEKGNRIV